MSCIATVGKCGITVKPSFTNQQINSVICNDKVEPRYLYYCFRQLTYELEAAGGGGSVYTNVSKARFSELEVPLPSLPEQCAIAHILGTLDEKIELNRRMNETLEAMAQALFKSWFVDFEPFRDRGMEESPSGSIPKGWTHISLGSFTKLDKGVSYKGKFLSDDGLPMINLGCFLGHGEFSLQNLKYYAGDYRDRHLVYPGDIVIANTDITQKREVLGSPAIVPPSETHNSYLFTHHVYAIRFDNNHQHWKRYVFFSLLEAAFRERAVGFATGTTVLALPRDAILDYQVVNPGDRLIDAFADQLEPMLALKYVNDKQSHTLATLRDALSPKLLSGEIRVKDAQRLLRQAV
jgi:type I restriction enzyme S subunit